MKFRILDHLRTVYFRMFEIIKIQSNGTEDRGIEYLTNALQKMKVKGIRTSSLSFIHYFFQALIKFYFNHDHALQIFDDVLKTNFEPTISENYLQTSFSWTITH